MKVNSKSAGFIGLTVILLAAFFLYYFKFNRYHLWYLEQNQLFRYEKGYILDFFQRPGGFILMTGAFFTRFFYNAWLAALIVTGFAGTFFYLTTRVLKHYRFNYFVPGAFPVLILAGLHSNHNYLIAYTAGWLIVLAVFYFYIRIKKPLSRYVSGLILLPALFYLCGFFLLMIVPLFILHEFLLAKERKRYIFSAGMVITGLLVPLLFQRYIFLTGEETTWVIPLNPIIVKAKGTFLLLLPAYLVLLIASVGALRKIQVSRTVVALSSLVFLGCGFIIIRANYDSKNEMFLHMEACYRQSDYRQVLSLSRQYPGNNQLVIYYTNLALCRLGELSEKMFLYNQSGSQGLWLEWNRNETAPLYGSDFYETVGYNSEAFRWAFESLEINDLNPRSLKKLVIASTINGQENLAEKYRNLLKQNSHYASWSEEGKEAAGKHLVTTHDFISTGSHPYELMKLLENNPGNKPAFEYMMASFLLDKNLEAFASQLHRLKELGYTHIPRYFEEAILLYSGVTKKDIAPAGYSISDQTLQRFHSYASLFAANRYSMENASKVLGRNFGDSFWYYMQFKNLK